MKSPLQIPFCQRKYFCVLVSVAAGLYMAFSMPGDLVALVPMVRAAVIVNALILGFVITLAGVANRQPVFGFRFHPLLRGAVIGALIHLDFMIYAWSDQRVFWSTIIMAAIFGALLDWVATMLFGEGRKLTKDLAV